MNIWGPEAAILALSVLESTSKSMARQFEIDEGSALFTITQSGIQKLVHLAPSSASALFTAIVALELARIQMSDNQRGADRQMKKAIAAYETTIRCFWNECDMRARRNTTT